MAAALPDPGWPRGNCPILLLATTVRRSFHHHRLLPGLRPCSTQRKDVLYNPTSLYELGDVGFGVFLAIVSMWFQYECCFCELFGVKIWEIRDTSRNGNLCAFAESRCDVLNCL